ncbi:MAG: ThiF family adenylyltransferase [Desulforudis sp.]|nr:MAG: ThiF family adenylyltransferase [Desulforudis sp.]
MTGHRITLLGSHDRELKEWLLGDPSGYERGAIILFRRLARKVHGQPSSDRFLAVEVIKMSEDWILESSPTHLKINLRKLPELYLRCETERLELGFAHSHPRGHDAFSHLDTDNEKNILHGLSGCNGNNSFFVAMILADGKWHTRIRHGSNFDKLLYVRHTCVVSDKIELHGIAIPHKSAGDLIRQEAAFGKPFNAKLQSLRAVVVGVGGTGSPLATLLARAGVGEIILIDGDILEESNMNRVRGYRAKDITKSKAQSLTDFIACVRPGISISAINAYLNESGEAIDALSSADIIFGCTDDQAGRNIMNQAMYYYAQVYIDVGLTGKIDTDPEGHPYLRDHRGRVSCILPEFGSCLRCQRVVTDQRLRYEQAIRDNPALAKLDPITLERDYYLIGGGEQAPGVGPFTSSTADNAVATFMDLVRPYRILPPDLQQDNIWTDFVNLRIYSNAPIDDQDCIYCRTHAILLKNEGKYRLEMPQLGEIHRNE